MKNPIRRRLPHKPTIVTISVAFALAVTAVSGCATVADAPDEAEQAAVVLSAGQAGAFVDGHYLGPPPGPIRDVVMPAEHVQGSGWVRYEGPAWESSLVGFRLYLDQRNLIDVFGKRVTSPSLETAPADYHTLNAWGADILHVGSSLGAGSIAVMGPGGVEPLAAVNYRRVEVIESGPLNAALAVHYVGWRTDGRTLDAESRFTLRSDSRCTEHRFTVISGSAPPLVTGLVRHVRGGALRETTEGDLTIYWTWGTQSDQQQDMGLAVIADAASSRRLEPDANSWLIGLDSSSGVAQYWICAGWSQEALPIRDAAEFERTLRAEARHLTRER